MYETIRLFVSYDCNNEGHGVPTFYVNGQRISALDSSDVAVWKKAVSLRGERCACSVLVVVRPPPPSRGGASGNLAERCLSEEGAADLKHKRDYTQ